MKIDVCFNDLARSWGSAHRGFSLLDAMLAVGLVFVLGAVSLHPLQEGIQAYRLDRAVSLTVSKLERARALATSRGTIAEVELDSQSGTIAITDLGDPETTGIGSLVLESGISLQKQPEDRIRFFPRGSARGGTLTIGDQHGYSKSITVTGAGLITVTLEGAQDRSEGTIQ